MCTDDQSMLFRTKRRDWLLGWGASPFPAQRLVSTGSAGLSVCLSLCFCFCLGATMKIICLTNLPLCLPLSSLFSFAVAVVRCFLVFNACKHSLEDVSTFACLCVHRNQAEPSEQIKLSAVEEKRNMEPFSLSRAQSCFLMAALSS